MTYAAMNSYYTFQPHEIMSGMGSYQRNSYFTFQPGEIMSGMGADVADAFNPTAIMNDIAVTNVCWGPSGTGKASGACNAASVRVSKDLSAALNQLGYGPIPVDGSLAWQGGYEQFLADHGLTKGPGLGVTKQALLTMKQQLQKGATPGGGEVVEFEKVGGEFVPKTGGVSKAAIAVGVLAVAGLGALAIMRNKKKKKKAKR